jgi:hypothetical protein
MAKKMRRWLIGDREAAGEGVEEYHESLTFYSTLVPSPETEPATPKQQRLPPAGTSQPHL